MSTQHSKVTIAGHPIHPMLIAFPITFYTTTLISFIAYAVTESLAWWQIGIRANVAGVVTAAIAAVPGFIDWSKGIPNHTRPKATGRNHMLLNVVSSTLFVLNLFAYRHTWDLVHTGAIAPMAHPDPVGAIVLSAFGMIALGAAGFLGFRLVQTHHVGIDLNAEQERLESHTLR